VTVPDLACRQEDGAANETALLIERRPVPLRDLVCPASEFPTAQMAAVSDAARVEGRAVADSVIGADPASLHAAAELYFALVLDRARESAVLSDQDMVEWSAVLHRDSQDARIRAFAAGFRERVAEWEQATTLLGKSGAAAIVRHRAEQLVDAEDALDPGEEPAP
jgi:hypothetical protein